MCWTKLSVSIDLLHSMGICLFICVNEQTSCRTIFTLTIRYMKKIMRWRPKDFGGHSNGAGRPIRIGNSLSKKKTPQTWSPKRDETLSYRQIALPMSRWRSIPGITVLCRRPRYLLLNYLRHKKVHPHIQLKYLPGTSLLRHYCFLLPIDVGFSQSNNHTCFSLPLHILCIQLDVLKHSPNIWVVAIMQQVRSTQLDSQRM